MYAIVRGETKGVGKLSVDGMAGKVLSRSAETVLRLDGAMAKKARPWLTGIFTGIYTYIIVYTCIYRYIPDISSDMHVLISMPT